MALVVNSNSLKTMPYTSTSDYACCITEGIQMFVKDMDLSVCFYTSDSLRILRAYMDFYLHISIPLAILKSFSAFVSFYIVSGILRGSLWYVSVYLCCYEWDISVCITVCTFVRQANILNRAEVWTLDRYTEKLFFSCVHTSALLRIFACLNE